jgi:hypothetical protein
MTKHRSRPKFPDGNAQFIGLSPPSRIWIPPVQEGTLVADGSRTRRGEKPKP